ncbi:hypothetical protein ACLB2K_037506 [Fragaria x ananassa]
MIYAVREDEFIWCPSNLGGDSLVRKDGDDMPMASSCVDDDGFRHFGGVWKPGDSFLLTHDVDIKIGSVAGVGFHNVSTTAVESPAVFRN